MGKENQSFKMAIKSYLEQRAKEDSLFAVSYAKENKSIDECCDYIVGEAKKRGGNAVVMSDNEVFGMAVHYYDEDDIKVNKQSNYKTATSQKPKEKVESVSKKDIASNSTQSGKRKGKKKETSSLQFSLFEEL